MIRYDKLIARLHKGERIIIDGATGSEAERRGVPTLDDAWSGGGNLSHPDIVREIHEEYIRVGAEIIISNSFATTRHALRDAGIEAQFESSNRRAWLLVAYRIGLLPEITPTCARLPTMLPCRRLS